MARLSTFALLLTLGIPPVLVSADFRVLTTVSHDRQTLLETTTLFVGPKIYDFSDLQDGQREIMIVDTGKRTLTLLVPAAKQHTTVSFGTLEQLAKTVANTADSEQHPAEIRFAAAPHFERTWNAEDNRLTLAHPLMTYSVQMVAAEDREATDRYRTFADAAARLATLQPGMPAQARLELNRQVAELNRLPGRVEKSVQGQNLTSLHQYDWSLGSSDREVVTQIEKWLKNSSPAQIGQYLERHR